MNLEGLCIEATKVTGLVTLSRLKPGGGAAHHVMLIKGPAAGDTVIIDHEDVTKVYDGEER